MCGSDKTCGCGCEVKASRAPARSRRDRDRQRDVVLTDRQGRPFDRPRRADYRTEGEYLDAYDDYRQRVMEAMSGRGMQLEIERDPSRAPLVEGGLYYLEWSTHDEADEGPYIYQGIYPQTGAAMFRRVSRFPKARVTLYLFPHEVHYLELLQRSRGSRGPVQGDRAPRLQPGRVLLRLKRNRVWDEGIAGSSIVQAARFEGFRRIDGEMFGVWSVHDVLYAQPVRA